MSKVCDMNCFNCKFSDCINNDFSSLEERNYSKDIDIQHRQDGHIPRSTKYYRKHPDRCKECQSRSVAKHRDEVYARNKKYYEKHKEEISARKRAYYIENKDKILADRKAKYTPHPIEVIDTPEAEASRQSAKAYYHRNKDEINRRRRERYKKRRELEKCKLQLETTSA